MIGHEQASAAWRVLRLAGGTASEPDFGGASWQVVLDVARRERLAGVAWLRGGALVRRMAPTAVVGAWRQGVLTDADRADAQLRALDALLARLRAVGVQPVVLKGAPLSVALYGEPWARPCADIDLFVPSAQRDAAHAVLVAGGWRHVGGTGAEEGVYCLGDAGRAMFLEVHSSLLDENMLRHMELPEPMGEPALVGGAAVDAHGGALSLVFLAAHLAKHVRPPLLWWLDFASSRRRAASELATAERMADELRLGRHLQWAHVGADAVDAAIASPEWEGTDAVSRLLEVTAEAPVQRLASLAATPLDRVRVRLAWVWPHSLRATPADFARWTLERGVRWGARRVRALRRGPGNE